MSPDRRVTPWTNLDTAIAHGAIFIGEVKAGTPLCIQLPGLVTVVHFLIPRRNGFTGAVLSA